LQVCHSTDRSALLFANGRYGRRLAAAPSFESDRPHQCWLVRLG
jgi:hypothetical protein